MPINENLSARFLQPKFKEIDDMSNVMTKEESKQIFDEMFGMLKVSKYRVQRAFNKLNIKEKEIILHIAQLEPSDIKNNLKQTKLEHFTESGRLKIAEAFKTLRAISANMPKSLRVAEFIQIEE